MLCLLRFRGAISVSARLGASVQLVKATGLPRMSDLYEAEVGRSGDHY